LAEVPVLVIGLGRFGTALAETLSVHGHEVLGVDLDPELVQRAVDRLTHVVQADATNLAAMRQLGASDFQHAVVAIGDQIEASILSTAVLVDLGVPDIWAKAITAAHGKILQRVGAHHVVLPSTKWASASLTW
jgi:trk system potassium uptake protein